MDFSLNPVVEFEPATYATAERAFPLGTSAQEPDAWDAYWRACLADAGIVGLDPFEPGSWLVPVDRLVDPHVLDAVLGKRDGGEWSSTTVGLSQGGYVLSAGGAHLQPGCCGDLSNLDDWRVASEHRTDDWAMVWIGHPWTHVSANQDVLTILEPSERESPLDRAPFCSVPRDVLADAIERASQAVSSFEERLRRRLGERGAVAPTE